MSVLLFDKPHMSKAQKTKAYEKRLSNMKRNREAAEDHHRRMELLGLPYIEDLSVPKRLRFKFFEDALGVY